MGIDFTFLVTYNLAKEEKLTNFNIYYTICQQERIIIMDDPEAIMKAFVEKVLSECHDLELLDLIYTLLVLNIEGKEYECFI